MEEVDTLQYIAFHPNLSKEGNEPSALAVPGINTVWGMKGSRAALLRGTLG